MSEELQTTLNDALKDIIETTAQAKDFILAEMPEVINQLLWWHGIKSGISMICFSMLCYAIYRFNKWQCRYYSGKNINNHPELMFNCLQSLLILPLEEFWSLDWLQIMVAPKLYLIEYTAELVK